MLEQTWEQKLSELVAKEPAALSESDIVFLRARRSYLTVEQSEKYAEVLGEKPTEKAEKPKKK